MISPIANGSNILVIIFFLIIDYLLGAIADIRILLSLNNAKQDNNLPEKRRHPERSAFLQSG
jgi:hypothetical protein